MPPLLAILDNQLLLLLLLLIFSVCSYDMNVYFALFRKLVRACVTDVSKRIGLIFERINIRLKKGPICLFKKTLTLLHHFRNSILLFMRKCIDL